MDSDRRPPEDQITRSFAKRPTRALFDQPVRLVTRSCYKAGMAVSRVIVHVSRSEHRVLDPEDVYYLRARGGETVQSGGTFTTFILSAHKALDCSG